MTTTAANASTQAWRFQPGDISESLVQAAHAADLAVRDPLRSWTRVPDDQVRRLIAGALNATTVQCTGDA